MKVSKSESPQFSRIQDQRDEGPRPRENILVPRIPLGHCVLHHMTRPDMVPHHFTHHHTPRTTPHSGHYYHLPQHHESHIATLHHDIALDHVTHHSAVFVFNRVFLFVFIIIFAQQQSAYAAAQPQQHS